MSDLSSQLSCGQWSQKDPLGTWRCIATGTEEMTGILQKEGRKRKEELLLQGMKHAVSKSQEESVRTQLVQDVCRAGPRTTAAVRLAFLRAGSKVKVIKARGSDYTARNTTFQRATAVYNATSNDEGTNKRYCSLYKMISQSFFNLSVFDY